MTETSFPIPGFQLGDIIQADQFNSSEPLSIKVVSGPVHTGGFAKLTYILKGQILSLEPAADPLRLVAMQVILTILPTKSDNERIRRELAAVKRAQHHHILPFIGARATGSHTILISPFMKNGNMLEYINANPAARKEELIQSVALAVDYLHSSLGLVHGDLQCQHVLISDDGHALLSGFHRSTPTVKVNGEDDTCYTIYNSITLRFAAPELLLRCPQPQLRLRSGTTQTDVFAFGLLIVQAFTKTALWPGWTRPEVYYSRVILQQAYRRPVHSVAIGLTDDWWRLCKDCWQIKPQERPSMAKIYSRIASITGVEDELHDTQPDGIARWLQSAGFALGKVIQVDQFNGGDPLSIEIVSGVVGKGGSARVVKGQIQSLATPSLVAVKIIPSLLSGRTTEKELAMVRRVRHRFILAFVAASSSEQYTILVSAFMEKGNMLQFIKANQAAHKESLLLQVAIAVDHLHRCEGMVHGDLKCQNVLISDHGIVQLADFGLATEVEKLPTDSTTAVDIRKMKTVSFSAPELFEDNAKSPAGKKRSKTPQTDIFAFGMLVLQAFTGRSPWPRIDADDVKSKVISKKTPPRPKNSSKLGLTDPWWKLCQRCWTFNPADRPSMEVLQRSIHSILGLSQLTGCIGRCAGN